ncbi:MAG: HAD family hydrolase [Nitrospira sp. BO4]|jgi:HAD superfamily hydrolase (TIGR01484 family)|nr:HAD family hydrolase [Nitrospira sp. BO4]
MKYVALATDYDSTLASAGRVKPETITALERLIQSGRKLVLVTGRLLPDILDIFPEIALCERVVADNGAVLYRPATREQISLAPRIPAAFVDELRRRKVPELSVAESIVSTVRPHELTLLAAIRDLGLELQVIFNRDAVMVVPAGINKASGLVAALSEMGLSPRNVVAIGDAENDHALLNQCEYAVAVANAVSMLKESADWVTTGAEGCGVSEIIDELVKHDMQVSPFSTSRRNILIGTRQNGAEVAIPATGLNLLLAGSSGSGKSTLATGILERVMEQGYQFCIIDPEGDYEGFAGAVMFGTSQRGPSVTEILTALEGSSTNVVVNLVGVPLHDRPAFFLALLPALQERRAKFGRPHWILVDEAHHLMPREWQPVQAVLAQDLTGMVYVTVHPDQVAKSVLRTADIVVSLGEDPAGTIRRFCQTLDLPMPSEELPALDHGEAVFWDRRSTEPPHRVRIAPCEAAHQRHRRKYAEGELPTDRSFYFRGPENALNLRAHNLIQFMQLAEGVDKKTWLHHLRRGDYSTWMLEGIKDPQLADAARQIEQQPSLSAERSRQLIRSAIEERYTVPSTGL